MIGLLLENMAFPMKVQGICITKVEICCILSDNYLMMMRNGRQTLRGLNKEFYHQTRHNSANRKLYFRILRKIFRQSMVDQYLRTTQIPTFTYRVLGKSIGL